MKEKYISLMDKTLSAYTEEHIVRYFDDVKRDGLKEHGFPRLTANMGILIAHGYRKELKPLFIEMMDFCCENVPCVKAANDFSVKELIFCIMALEEKGGVDKSKTDYWRACLKTIEVQRCYNVYAKTPTDKVYNWALFTAVSEYMRQYIGLCDATEFVDLQIPTQLQWLDENCMYKDPNNPIVYDLVPRGLFAVLLHFGYKGRFFDEIDGCLKKAGLLSLKMQSVSGEIPYGGRSNQFLHNEAHFAVVAEYEAKRYGKEGDFALASAFKTGVKKALSNIEMWIEKRPIRHIKNRFPTETMYGCEDYAYFDKYMITTASFLYAAYLICDDSIEAAEEDSAPYTLMLSKDFHKAFMKAGGYFLEMDTEADPHYDASGVGRLHKAEAPTTICMSVPCAADPSIVIDLEKKADISLCAGYGCDESYVFATDKKTEYEVIDHRSDGRSAYLKVKNVFESGKTVFTDYGLDESGLNVTVTGENEVAYMLPVFDYDGENYTNVTVSENKLTVEYEGYVCVYKTDGVIADLNAKGGNRNGHYRAFCAKGTEKLNVKVEITKIP